MLTIAFIIVYGNIFCNVKQIKLDYIILKFKVD